MATQIQFDQRDFMNVQRVTNHFDERKDWHFLSSGWFAGLNLVAMELTAYAMVKGFSAGCTPLEALLPSTLDCLYHIQCLQLLFDYFPSLKQVNSWEWRDDWDSFLLHSDEFELEWFGLIWSTWESLSPFIWLIFFSKTGPQQWIILCTSLNVLLHRVPTRPCWRPISSLHWHCSLVWMVVLLFSFVYSPRWSLI